MSVTVKDCLSLPSLCMGRVITGRNGLSGIVSSVTVFEFDLTSDDIFTPNELAITAFYDIRNSIPDQVETIKAAKRSGIVALVLFYSDMVLHGVDRKVVEAADQCNLPLILLSGDDMGLKYSDVIHDISEAIFSDARSEDFYIDNTIDRILQMDDRHRSLDTVLGLISEYNRSCVVLCNSNNRILGYSLWPAGSSLNVEKFFANFRILMEEGYLKIAPKALEFKKKKDDAGEEEETGGDASTLELLMKLRKGMKLAVKNAKIKEGETSPPKRYNSGSMILAMENAGQLIEDEDLRAQIKGSGIGTSATRAEILKKLVNNKYIALNKKTQIITPTLLGENIFDVVSVSIRSLLNPELTASWEKGLTYVAEGQITQDEYMGKLEHFVRSRTEQVLGSRQHFAMRPYFEAAAAYHKKTEKTKMEQKTPTKQKGE